MFLELIAVLKESKRWGCAPAYIVYGDNSRFKNHQKNSTARTRTTGSMTRTISGRRMETGFRGSCLVGPGSNVVCSPGLGRGTGWTGRLDGEGESATSGKLVAVSARFTASDRRCREALADGVAGRNVPFSLVSAG